MKDGLVGVLVAVAASIFVTAYILKFGSLQTSSDPSDWADFATYLSGTVGITAVLGTLFAVVRTLGQQQDLVESQRIMLEKQEEQLEFEKNKEEKFIINRKREENYNVIYLLHHFKVLKEFYDAAGFAINNKDAKIWLPLLKDNPSTYPGFFIDDSSDNVVFMNRLNGRMAVDFAASLAYSKQLNHVLKFPVGRDEVDSCNMSILSERLRYLDSNVQKKGMNLVKLGLGSCKSFIEQAEQITKQHVSEIDNKL